jgi:hypothetical protein
MKLTIFLVSRSTPYKSKPPEWTEFCDERAGNIMIGLSKTNEKQAAKQEEDRDSSNGEDMSYFSQGAYLMSKR